MGPQNRWRTLRARKVNQFRERVSSGGTVCNATVRNCGLAGSGIQMPHSMNVFISWSGTRSREVAVSLKQWIPALLPTSEPWIASDLPTGSNWSREITHRLQQAHTGIICLTEENRNSPWLLFEAGALARAGKLFLYLIDFDAAELAGPLAQFQATRANEEGTWKLILALNSATEQQAPENELQDRFNRRWPQLRDSLAATRAPGVETLSLVFGDVVGSTRLVATAGDLSVQKIFGDLFARASEFNRSNRGQSLKRSEERRVGKE